MSRFLASANHSSEQEMILAARAEEVRFVVVEKVVSICEAGIWGIAVVVLVEEGGGGGESACVEEFISVVGWCVFDCEFCWVRYGLYCSSRSRCSHKCSVLSGQDASPAWK